MQRSLSHPINGSAFNGPYYLQSTAVLYHPYHHKNDTVRYIEVVGERSYLYNFNCKTLLAVFN